MKKYITYEDPLQGRIFTEKQMYEVYRDLADKKEYPGFESWLTCSKAEYLRRCRHENTDNSICNSYQKRSSPESRQKYHITTA